MFHISLEEVTKKVSNITGIKILQVSLMKMYMYYKKKKNKPKLEYISRKFSLFKIVDLSFLLIFIYKLTKCLLTQILYKPND